MVLQKGFNALNLISKCIVPITCRRKLSNHAILLQNAQQTNENLETSVDHPYVDFSCCNAWHSGDQQIETIKLNLIKDMTILPNFVSEEEEKALIAEVEPYLKKMRYEFDHWDDAIHGFRETERTAWSGVAAEALLRAHERAIQPPSAPLPHTHVLDLDAKGYIKPHVDAVRFCGDTVAGICLLSPAVMRLRHSVKDELYADFLLSHRCLYIMSGTSRYDFSHEVLKQELSFFRGTEVLRARRISLICRSQPNPKHLKQ